MVVKLNLKAHLNGELHFIANLNGLWNIKEANVLEWWVRLYSFNLIGLRNIKKTRKNSRDKWLIAKCIIPFICIMIVHKLSHICLKDL